MAFTMNIQIKIKMIKPGKLLAFTALLFLASLTGQSQSANDVRERKIKSIYLVTTDQRKGQSIVKNTLTHYDHKGNAIEIIEFNADSIILSHEKFKFNKNNDETENIILDSLGNNVKKIVTEYDKWKNISAKFTYDKDGLLIEKTLLTYNNSNDKTSETSFDKEGKTIRKVLYEYDNKGMLISRKTYNEKNELTYSRSYSYEY